MVISTWGLRRPCEEGTHVAESSQHSSSAEGVEGPINADSTKVIQDCLVNNTEQGKQDRLWAQEKW